MILFFLFFILTQSQCPKTFTNTPIGVTPTVDAIILTTGSSLQITKTFPFSHLKGAYDGDLALPLDTVHFNNFSSSDDGSFIFKIETFSTQLWVGIGAYESNSASLRTQRGLLMYFSNPPGATTYPQTNGVLYRRKESETLAFTPNFQTNRVALPYFGFGKIERKGSVLTSYYSDDGTTWLFLTSMNLLSPTATLSWGFTIASTQSLSKSVTFSRFEIEGLGTSCSSSSCSLTAGRCVPTSVSDYLECSKNSWRFVYSATLLNSIPTFTIEKSRILVQTNLNVQNNPLDNEETLFFFKELSGSGTFDVLFGSATLNDANNFFGVQIREIPSKTDTNYKITGYTTYQCLARKGGFLINSRNETVSLLTNSGINPDFSNSISMRLAKSGDTIECYFLNTTSNTYRILDSRRFPVSSSFHIGIISNINTIQNISAVNYTSFNGYCNNRATSCGLSTQGAMDQCNCVPGSDGPECENILCYGINSKFKNVCSGYGNCIGPNNCSCQVGYYDLDCSNYQCFGISQKNQTVCNSQGNCTNIDTCNCNSGYGGSNCFPICQGILSSSPKVCNSRGNCTSPNICSCQTNYFGNDCESFYCDGVINNSTLVCNSRGKCSDFNNCTCNTGYTGSSCQFPLCFGISSNNSSVCSTQGNCTSPNTCSCNSNYTGTNCQNPLCFGVSSNSSSVCSSQGICTSPNNCICSMNYTGSNCQFPICYGVSSNNSNVCGSKGICSSPNNCSCFSGYGGSSCLPICQGRLSGSPFVCSSKGSCISPNICNCSSNYFGNDCQNYNCNGVINNSTLVCNSQGICVDFNNCSCNSTYTGSNCQFPICFGISANNSNVCSSQGNCTLPDVCSCNPLYSGKSCQFATCFGILGSNPSVCSSRGNCSSPNNCTCPSGYTGSICQFPICNGVSSNNSNVCSRNGECILPNVCSCNTGYIGEDCQYPKCYGLPSNNSRVCGSQGICISPDNCKCNSTHIGEQCQIPICYGKPANNSNVCSGNGNCTSYNNCNCSSGYGGFNCQFPLCDGLVSSDPLVCNSRGDCIGPNKCDCDSKWNGTLCQYPNCFGFSAVDYGNVCTGNGNCISYNNCSCNQTGLNIKCDSLLFYWKYPISGSWSNVSNWVFKGEEGSNPIDSTRVPKELDRVFIDLPGLYTVFFDSNETFRDLTIGHTNEASLANIIFKNNQNKISRSLVLYKGATITLENAVLTSLKTQIHGDLNATNSQMFFNGDTTMDTISDLSQCDLYFNGELTVLRGEISSSKTIFNNTISTFQGSSKLVISSPTFFDPSFNMKGSSTLQVDFPLVFKKEVIYSSSKDISGKSSISFEKTLAASTSKYVAIYTPLSIRGESSFLNGNFIFNQRVQFNSSILNNANLEFWTNITFISPNITGVGKLYFMTQTLFRGSGSILNEMFVYNLLDVNGIYKIKSFTINGSLLIGANSYFETIGTSNILSKGIQSSESGFLSIASTGTLNVLSSILNSNILCEGILKIQGSTIQNGAIFNLTKTGSIDLTNTRFLSALFEMKSTNSYFDINSNTFKGDGSINFNLGTSSFTGISTLPLLTSFVNHKLSLSGNITFGSLFLNDQLSQFTLSTGSYMTFLTPNTIILSKDTFTGAGNIYFPSNSNPTFTSTVDASLITSSIILSTKLIFRGKTLVFMKGSFLSGTTIDLETNSYLEIRDIFRINILNSKMHQLFINNGNLIVKGTLICQESLLFTIPVQIEGSLEIPSLSETSFVNLIVKGSIKGPGSLITSGKLDFVSGDINNIQGVIEGTFEILEKTSKLISNSNIQLNGIMNQNSESTLSLTGSTQVIIKGTLNQYSGVIISDNYLGTKSDTFNVYSIVNNGDINLSTNNSLSFLASFINRNRIKMTGKGVISLTSNFLTTPYTLISVLETTLNVPNNFTVTAGNLFVSGTIITNLFTFSSNTGLMRFVDPSTVFNIIGSFSLLREGTLVVEMKEKEKNQIIVSNHTSIQGLVYIKFIQFKPQLNTELPFLKSKTYDHQDNINLIGMGFSKAVYKRNADGLSFVIRPSIGIADDKNRYKCHYFGNSKTIEFLFYRDNNGISITFTTPRVSNGWVGFGFNLLGNINSSISIIYSNQTTFQILNHTYFIDEKQNQYLLDFSTSQGKNFFNIGEEYLSMSLFLQQNVLTNQTHLFYAHNLNEKAYANSNYTLIPMHTYYEQKEFKISDKSEVSPCTNFIVPTRGEIYEPAVTSLMLIFYVFITILCIAFYKHQPLNSRGISPYFTLLFLFTQLILEIRNYFYITAPQASLCLYYAYGIFPLTQICFLVIFIYFMRYFAIINFNNTKNQASKDQTMVTSKFKIRLLKFIASSWFTFGSLFISLVLVLIIYTLVLMSTAFVCTFDSLIALKTINNLELIIIYLATLGLLIGDLISNFSFIIKKNFIKYLRKDPYYFRIQIMLFVPFMIYNLITEVITLFFTIDYASQLTYFASTITFYTITCTIVLIIDVLFPLSITIILFLRKLCFKHKPNLVIDDLIKNVDLYPQFEDFCRSEYSIENLLCYNDIQLFKKKKKDPMVIYQTYFTGVDALFEVNVPSSQCRDALALIESSKYDENLFARLELSIITNLSDTYSRFIFTSGYLQYEAKKNLQIELIEGKK